MSSLNNWRRLGVAFALTALVATSAACTRNAGTTPNGGGPAATTGPASTIKTNAQGYPEDPCGLIPKTLIESTLAVTTAVPRAETGTCTYETADGATKYKLGVYPGQTVYGTFALSGSSPGFQKVSGPWQEAVFFQDPTNKNVTLAFRTKTWTGVTTATGASFGTDAGTVTKLTTIATALGTALGGAG